MAYEDPKHFSNVPTIVYLAYDECQQCACHKQCSHFRLNKDFCHERCPNSIVEELLAA